MAKRKKSLVPAGLSLILAIALCLAATGCVTQSWAQSEIRGTARNLRSDMEKTAASIRAEIATARADNAASYELIGGLDAEAARLRATLDSLAQRLDQLNKHVETSLEAQTKQLTEGIEAGDRGVKDSLLAEHQEAVAALRTEMEGVEEAGRRADELAKTLQEMIAVYKTTVQEGAKE